MAFQKEYPQLDCNFTLLCVLLFYRSVCFSKTMKTSSKGKIPEPEFTKLFKKLFKYKPKPRVISVNPDDKTKAKLMEKLIEHNWWLIEDRFNKEVLRPMVHCMMYGTHRWRGYGVKDRHICKVCGWKTHTMIDPKFMGIVKVEWDV